jgi:hypothetical protein
MPQVGQAPIRSAEELRTLYRALGMSEETLTRAIQFTKAGSGASAMPKLPKTRRRRGPPRRQRVSFDQAEGKPPSRKRAAGFVSPVIAPPGTAASQALPHS